MLLRQSEQCEALTGSTGSYVLIRSCLGQHALVMYSAPGYETLALVWPQELETHDKDCECCDELKDVALAPRRAS